MKIVTQDKEIKDYFYTPPPLTDFVEEKIDGVVYTYNKSDSCHVCIAPQPIQTLVDRLLLDGHSYAEIVRLLDPLQDQLNTPEKERISYGSVWRHKKNHLPIEKLAAREVIERRARERGKKILEGTDNLLTYAAVLENVQRLGFTQIVMGTQLPNVDQTLKASQLLHELEELSSANFKVEEVIVQFNVLIEAVKRNVTPDVWVLIVEEIEKVRNRPQGELNP